MFRRVVPEIFFLDFSSIFSQDFPGFFRIRSQSSFRDFWKMFLGFLPEFLQVFLQEFSRGYYRSNSRISSKDFPGAIYSVSRWIFAEFLAKFFQISIRDLF